MEGMNNGQVRSVMQLIPEEVAKYCTPPPSGGGNLGELAAKEWNLEMKSPILKNSISKCIKTKNQVA